MHSHFLDTFIILSPLFILIAGGWLLSTFFSISEDTLTRVLSDFFMPLLVFISLYRSDITPGDTLDLLGTVVFMVGSMYLVVLLYCRLTGADMRSMGMPVIFMNSGFLGIPLMQLWSGTDAMNVIIVFDQLQTLFIFSLGFIIVAGGFSLRGLRLSLLSPILWAVVLGFSFHIFAVPVPAVLIDTFVFAGNAAAPLAAFIVGCSLSSHAPRVDVHVVAGILLRMGVGLASGIAAVYIFNLTGLIRTVVIVASALPAAVFSYVLPSRYGVPAEDAQSIVIISTLLGIITIPLTFSLSQLF